MKNAIIKVLKYPLILFSALLIGLLFSSMNTYYELSKVSKFSLLTVFIVIVCTIATLLTVDTRRNLRRKTSIKYIFTFVGWCAAMAIVLVVILFHQRGEVEYYIPRSEEHTSE